MQWKRMMGWVGMAVWVLVPGAGAQSLRIEVPRAGAEAVRVEVIGGVVENVNLEGSFDLNDWFILDSARPSDGRVEFRFSGDEVWAEARFYRAVAGPTPVTHQVGPQMDPLFWVTGLITPEEGGELTLTDERGVVYELKVAPERVWEPVVVRMTAITHFSALPLGEGFRAAVMFEPEGFEFRGSAGLTIRFPEAVPALEMVGYGFDAAGGDFHLRPWRVEGNTVRLSVDHFSGTGVAAEPYPVTGNFSQNYDRAWNFTRDAGRYADQWASQSMRNASRALQEGRMTLAEFEAELDRINRMRSRLEFLNGVAPLLEMAKRDCGTGEVVLQRLERLWVNAQPVLQRFLMAEFQKVAPEVRCRCAHYYIERCENSPASSGLSATRGLTDLLHRIELMTGRADAQGCDLGSDNQMWERLARAKCHKPWEGTVRYTRSEVGSYVLPGLTQTQTAELSYVGQVTELVEEDGEVDDDGRPDWHFWYFKTKGALTASMRERSEFETNSEGWKVQDLGWTDGTFRAAAEGELNLEFDRGLFRSVGASVGLQDVKYIMPTKTGQERKVTCRVKPDDCPSSFAPVFTAGTAGVSFAHNVDRVAAGGDAQFEVVESPGRLKVTHTLVTRTVWPAPIQGGFTRTEKIIVQLWQGSAR